MPLYRDEAIVLRTQKLGEADRIVTLLTRQHGRVRAVAKGVRRTRSRFGARLEPFDGRRRPAATRGASLDIVTQAETLAPYGDAIARDYAAYTAATAMLETAERLTEEREPAVQQYLLLVGGAALAGRAASTTPGLVLDAYLLRSLAVAGWAPSFHDCARCGAPGSAPGVQPSPAGGAVCPDCRPPGSAAPAPETLELLAALLAGDWVRRRRERRSGTAARAAAWSPPSCSGTSSAGCARCASSSAREPVAEPQRTTRRRRPCRRPPASVRRAAAGRPGRRSCPGTSPSSWTATAAGPTRAACRAPRATRPARPRCSTSSPARIEVGVTHLSAYAFSTENWKRSPDEVRFLMGFNRDVIRRRRDQMHEWGVRVRWAGRAAAAVAQRDQGARGRRGADRGTTTVLTLTMCVNYGGRAEIADAVRRIAERRRRAAGSSPATIDEQTIAPLPRRARHARRRPVRALARASSAPATSCSGSRPTPRWSSTTPLWPDFDRRDLWRGHRDVRRARPPLRRRGRRGRGPRDDACAPGTSSPDEPGRVLTCPRRAVGAGAEDLQGVRHVGEAVLGATVSAHCSTAGPSTSTVRPHARQTRWWWWPVLQRR